jgi:hypothetical protein
LGICKLPFAAIEQPHAAQPCANAPQGGQGGSENIEQACSPMRNIATPHTNMNPLDPFSALSVASSVVKFLDFSWQVVSKARDLNHSADGVSIDHAQSEAAAKRLANLAEGMRASLQLGSATSAVSGNEFVLVFRHALPEDKAIKVLCTSCIELSNQLIDKFGKLRVTAGTKHRRWKSLRQALKSVWSKKAIDDIRQKLNSYRKELEGHVLLSLRCVNFLKRLKGDWGLTRD